MEPEEYRARVHKFSSKPPGHDAARQRENQRRHRARVKSRINELESALSDTQSKLEDALRQIESLTAEVQRLHALGSETPTPQRQAVISQEPDHFEPDQVTQQKQSRPSSSSGPDIRERVCGISPPYIIPPRQPTNPASPDATDSDTQSPHSTSTPIPANVQNDRIPLADFENPENDCPLLPAPGTGESTIPCRDAYSIIKERSSPEFDLSAANEWLKPGFRSAIVPGAGCRVQTHILFAFVDHITPI